MTASTRPPNARQVLKSRAAAGAAVEPTRRRPGPTASLAPPERIDKAVLLIRRQEVMLDAGLADLSGIETRALVQAVTRNRDRSPADFSFQLTPEELRDSRSHPVMSSRGGRRTPPFVSTEQGVAMLSSVPHTEGAVRVNIEIMRAFVRLRRLLASHQDLARKLADLGRGYDAPFRIVFDATRTLMGPPDEAAPAWHSIGFTAKGER